MGLSDLGGAVKWGEAKLLIEAAAADPGTALGAELAGWAYPATTPALIALVAEIGNPKASKKLMPWAMKNPRQQSNGPTPDEVAEAAAELEDGIVFS